MMLDSYSFIPKFTEFINAINTPQPYWIRVNKLKISEIELIDRLFAKGFVLKRYKELNAYRIIKMPVKHPGATFEHSLGYYYVQDLSSMVPPLILNPQPNELVLDMAAAPGSKTTQMAELMNNTGTIVANDVSDGRIKALAANVERLGITNVQIVKGDATVRKFNIVFDKVLLDAPCTGEGTLRKTPKTKMPTLKDHIRMSKLQKKLLKNAVLHLKEGGYVVYSTCTFNPLENEDVVKFGVNELNLEPVEINPPVPHTKGVKEWMGHNFEDVYEYMVRIYPHMVDTGGMVIALLKK